MGAEDLIANGQDAVVVEYHISDVFETTGALARQNYYWVTALPTARFDGVIESVGGNNSTSIYPTYLPLYEQRKSILSDFTIDVAGVNSQLTDYVVDVTIEKVAPNSSTTLALMVALTESEIDYYWMGQEFVNYCERFMLPDANGTSLDFSNGDVQEFSFSFSLDPEWVQEKCELAVWIQDLSTKEVQQAAKRSLDAFGEFPSLDASIVNMYSPVTLCSNSIEPAVEVVNLGTDNLTSLDIHYHVNNEPAQTYSWTGNIAFSSSEVITLPQIDMSGINSGTVNILLENPNGSADEYPYNDTMSSVFVEAENVSSPVTLVLKLDDYPEQTSWELKNSDDEVLYYGGNYSDPGVFVTEAFDLGNTDCFSFHIYDSNGDGLSGTGLYKLMYGTTIFQTGKDFGLTDEVQFGIGLTDVHSDQVKNTFEVYPNPATDQLTVSSKDDGEAVLMDISGKVVRSQSIFRNENKLDLSGLKSGVYFLQIKGVWGISTQKVLIKRN